MKQLRLVLAGVFVAVVLLVPAATASAAAGYSDTIGGLEYYATSTEGQFAGTANGALPGSWKADVVHTPLCLTCTPTAAVTGGSFSLATVLNGWPTVVSGTFSGGYVQVTDPGSNCTNQTFTVSGILAGVHSWFGGNGSGAFIVKLTHYRHSLFGSCLTYAASVSGTLTLSF